MVSDAGCSMPPGMNGKTKVCLTSAIAPRDPHVSSGPRPKKGEITLYDSNKIF